ncbi:MAG: alpha/beta hydrolase [Actinobacteria bacterium]|nr:alpha/beta hydrolase [Actinomycetota bacterium]
MSVDSSVVLVAGPWEHRYVAANGARFHVASAGEGPLVLFLHAFPQFWWTWRRQLTALAEAGYRAVAMDLRGYGASDKPPTGYDAPTLTADVAGVIRSLGEADAVVVGHGIGGWLAWTLPMAYPDVVRAVAVAGCAHPAATMAAPHPSQAKGLWALLGINRPFHPEREMARGPAYVHKILTTWRGVDDGWPDAEEAARYAEAMAIPFVAHSAAESFRWLIRARLHMQGRHYLRRVQRPVVVPVLQLHGTHDQVVVPALAQRSARWCLGAYDWRPIDGAGHCPHEQAPADTTRELLAWLAGLDARR